METVRQRLKNLLILLLEAMADGSDESRLNRRRLQERMAGAGYDEADISSILNWLEDQGISGLPLDWQQTELANHAHSATVRLLGAEEQEYLTPAAFGYLLRLCQTDQIDREQMESLINYASLVSVAPMEPHEIDQLLEQVVFRHPVDFGLDFASGEAGPYH